MSAETQISESVDGSFMDVTLEDPEVEVASQSSMFVCDTCDKHFKKKTHLKRHIKTHDSSLKKTRCSDCNIYFTDIKSLDEHQSKKHAHIVCDVCGKAFKRRRDLTYHAKTHQQHQQMQHANGNEADSLVCPFEGCKKVFQRAPKYQDHINAHTKQKPYECSKCQKRYASRYTRTTHQQVCQGSQVECNTCGKIFKYKASLHNHNIAEHSISVFRCGCGATYKYQSGLIKHKKSKGHE